MHTITHGNEHIGKKRSKINGQMRWDRGREKGSENKMEKNNKEAGYKQKKDGRMRKA